MHSQLAVSYRKIKQIKPQHNAIDSKLQRQYAAAKYIELLDANKVLINIDESVISQTINRKRGWQPKGKYFTVTSSVKLNLVNIIAAVGSDGCLFYTINRGKTNSWSFLLFIIKLVEHLNRKDPSWRSKTVFMLDNAMYHRSNLTKSKLDDLKIPLMYMGPYQFRLAPIELFYSYIKGKDLNPLKT